jgi:aldose 1-epimerase
MGFAVSTSVRTAGGRRGDVVELFDRGRNSRVEVWTQWGFNCLRWQVGVSTGGLADLFFVAPDWDSNPVPTRSGHPILFPFPGRLREGAFAHEGRRYVLPPNDSTLRHAIHGFTPRNPWRVTGTNAGDDSASVSGEFSLRRDFPQALPLWPADFRLVVTYTLSTDRLRVDALLENLGPGTMPFGLGYHPYFRIPGSTEPDISRYVLQVDADRLWESIDLLPSGVRVPIPEGINYREPRPLGATDLDHVLSLVWPQLPSSHQLRPIAELSHPDLPGRLQILADSAFRELVLFTPTHRQAVAIEPYTCSADAANLAERGVDSGWRVLPPRASWSAAVEYHCNSGG